MPPHRESPPPFIIVGAPRTGTTLLRRILHAHPEVAIPPESLWIAEYLSAEHVPLERRKKLLARDPAFAGWGVGPSLDELAGCETMAECLRLAHAKYAAHHGKSRWGQKTPRLVRHGELLARHLPDALFVHTVRDPRAVANSLAQSRVHRLNVLVGAERYEADTRRGLELERALPGRTRRVRYEDLVQDPSSVVADLCKWLEIDFLPEMVDPHSELRREAAEVLPDPHRHVERPINAQFADKWRHERSRREIALVEQVTAATMQELGYPRSEPVSPPGALYRGSLRARHAAVVGDKAVRELRRPRVVALARRRWALGALGPMARNLLHGG